VIKLQKQPEPDILRIHGVQWLKTLEDKIAAGEKPTDSEKSRYRHPDIKSALKTETSGKCAYCESKLLHIAFGDVEHISPKSEKLAHTFQWENLTLACDVCNTYKSNAPSLVDPYVDEPSEFFRFLGPMVYAIPGQAKGVTTVIQLRLNRPELVENRSKRLEAISSIILTINQTADQSIKAVLINDLMHNETADGVEYAAFVRSFIDAVGLNLSLI
jgi:uncharacterized protein (TIGR02646 family)